MGVAPAALAFFCYNKKLKNGSPPKKLRALKPILDRFYRAYPFQDRLSHDPIAIPHRFSTPGDREAAGFIASCLAYGKVGLFMPVLDRVISLMGSSPSAFLMDIDIRKQRDRFRGIKYRFNENEDILALLQTLHVLLRSFGSLERVFMRHYHEEDETIEQALAGFVRDFLSVDTSKVYGSGIRTPGYLQFLPSPERGSACKRANLFLRWMVRARDIDLGVWKGIPPAKLVIPLDVHISRISGCLGLTSRKTQDWKAAAEITKALRELDPVDPLKYDFALCHHGISQTCSGIRRRQECQSCAFDRSRRNVKPDEILSAAAKAGRIPGRRKQ